MSTHTAKLFMSGRSQAIRLPAKLRLDATEVRIERVGDALWVQPENAPGQSIGWTISIALRSPCPRIF